MSMHARAPIGDEEKRSNKPVSPEEMERRKQLAADLQGLWNRPMTEEEAEFWRQFDAGLQRERLTFR